jgi:hypothetical protein
MSLNFLGIGRQANETLYEYLERRERELVAQTTVVRSELQTLETELAHVRSARKQVGNIPNFGKQANKLSSLVNQADLSVNAVAATNSLSSLTLPANNQLTNALIGTALQSNPPTIKDMILKALWSGFRETGATQAALRQFIKDAYGRDIDRTSLSPQIARLRDEGLLKQKGGEDNWRLTKAALDQLRADLRYGA